MTMEQLSRILADEDATQSALDVLTDREVEVLSLLSQGASSRRICEEMQLSPEDLGAYKERMQRKLGLKNELQLFQFAGKQRMAA